MIIPSGFGQINFRLGGAALPLGAECVLGFSNLSTDDPLTIAAAVGAHWDAEIQPQLVTTCEHVETLVKLGPNSTGPSAVSPSGVIGGQGGEATPPNVSVLISKVTNLGGRQGRGRMYLPCISEGDVTSGGIVAALRVSNIQIAFSDFAVAMVADGYPPALLRAEGSPLTTPEPITGFLVNGRVATQRRRNRR